MFWEAGSRPSMVGFVKFWMFWKAHDLKYLMLWSDYCYNEIFGPLHGRIHCSTSESQMLGLWLRARWIWHWHWQLMNDFVESPSVRKIIFTLVLSWMQELIKDLVVKSRSCSNYGSCICRAWGYETAAAKLSRYKNILFSTQAPRFCSWSCRSSKAQCS